MPEKKKKWLIWASAAALILAGAAALSFGICLKQRGSSRGIQVGTAVETTATAESKKTAGYDLSNEVYASFQQINAWESASRQYIQYEVVIFNQAAQDITNWSLTFPLPQNAVIEQFWNCSATQGTTVQSGETVLQPVAYNTFVQSGHSVQGMGFIVSMDEFTSLETYRLELTLSDVVYVVEGKKEEDPFKSEDDNRADAPAEMTQTQTASDPASHSEPSYGGLHVSKTALLDDTGNPVQLKGVSTHGLAWFPAFVNYEAFCTLKEWGVNVVRLALYTEEYGGYCSGGDREALKERIDEGVRYAAQLGMYVIIDWHILSDGNPNTHRADAVAFFDEMSSKYSGYNHVIYEICNEPVNAPWHSEIKPYAEAVIETIRSHDSDALILVGTNTWSQDIDAVIGDELTDGNVMYVMHFYAGTHKEILREKLTYALDSGIPVFISECGICDASGNGGIDYESAQAWLNLLDDRQISFVAWNLSDKNESAALLKPGCTPQGGWSLEELTESGKWFKEAFSAN